ncbi:MAG: type IV secretion system DNA-binding domain-containing protein, partial [Pseudomonadota bacterium]|nr:type IV secretion system DNA-binding domain-containing protein [Pseudomonadota bacterium]
VAGPAVLRWRGRAAPDTYKRGVIVAGDKAPRGVGDLSVAGVAIPVADETKHFKVMGTTGTGKSTAIAELLGGALARGDRAVFADPDGGYRQRFYKRYRGDIILNPFDRDSVAWAPFSEMADAYDAAHLAASLIPMTGAASSNEWRTYARTFLAAILRTGYATHRDVEELWRLLAVASSEELRSVLIGTPAQPFLDPDNSRMFGSIRAVAVSALAALDCMRKQRAAPFGVKNWVRGRGAPGALFITYSGAQIAALRSLIATWLRLAIFETMTDVSLDKPPLWFVIDELDSLGVIEGLKDALARLRKFGGRCVLGFQSIAQVSGTYGAAEAQTIVENCGNTLILRCSGSESGGTSQFASRLIGEREIVRRHVSHGRDRDGSLQIRGLRRSRTLSEQHVTEFAVMNSEIEQLPDLQGYFKGASSPVWRKVSIDATRRRSW